MVTYSCLGRDLHTWAGQADSSSTRKMPHIFTERKQSTKGMWFFFPFMQSRDKRNCILQGVVHPASKGGTTSSCLGLSPTVWLFSAAVSTASLWANASIWSLSRACYTSAPNRAFTRGDYSALLSCKEDPEGTQNLHPDDTFKGSTLYKIIRSQNRAASELPGQKWSKISDCVALCGLHPWEKSLRDTFLLFEWFLWAISLDHLLCLGTNWRNVQKQHSNTQTKLRQKNLHGLNERDQ